MTIDPNYRSIILLIIMAITLTLIVAIMIPPADAIRIEQGNQNNPNAIAYLNETVDLSLALAWPDFTIAFCKSGNPTCDPPDQVIKIEGFQHRYWIDPSVFHVGQYYRWSGVWNRGENQDAFYVMQGPRPVINESPVITPTPTPEPGIDAKGNGPFDYLVARGDSFRINLHFNEDTDVCSGENAEDYQGYLWLFGDAGTTKMILNDPLIKHGTDYEYTMTADKTGNLDTGSYTGFLQFTGRNTLQDIFWDTGKKCFDSPYSNTIVPDVCPTVEQMLYPRTVRDMFQKIVTSAKYSDDILKPITMEVVNPDVVISDLIQGQDTLWMTGYTSWAAGTTVTIRLDPDNYAKTEDKRLHTWTTEAYGDVGSRRWFNMTIPFDTDELYIGMHELKFTVDKNNYAVDAYHDFRVSGLYVTPTPTPVFEKVMQYPNGTRIRVLTEATTAIPTVTPNVTSEIVNITPISTRETLTTIPTPTQQIVIGKNVSAKVNVSGVDTTPSVVVPLNLWCGMLALVVAWVVVRR